MSKNIKQTKEELHELIHELIYSSLNHEHDLICSVCGLSGIKIYHLKKMEQNVQG